MQQHSLGAKLIGFCTSIVKDNTLQGFHWGGKKTQICGVPPSMHCLQPLAIKRDFPRGIIQHNSVPTRGDLWL